VLAAPLGVAPAWTVGGFLAVLGASALLPGAWARRVFLAAIGAFLVALFGFFAGMLEAVIVAGGAALVASMAFVGARTIRVLGPAWLALFLFLFLQTIAGTAVGVVLAVAVGALGIAVFPTRVSRRVAFLVPSMILLVYLTTVLMYLAPGNPFAQERATTQQALEQLQQRFKVYDSPTEYFGGFLEGLYEEGTLGLSTKVQGRTVEDLLLPALPVSVSLGLLALVMACAMGLFLGIRAGLRPNSLADYGSMAMAMVGISLPNFVIASVLIIVFSLSLGWFPVAGWGTYGNLVLPALSLALPYAAYIARLARNGTIEVMQQDFVRTARAKGLSERAVVLKHALRGAILPVVSFLGPAAAGIFTGSFVIEKLFVIPGMGQWFVNSALARDYSVVLGTAIIYFTIITIFNLLVDFAYAWLDPRVREKA
jgi:oligopeptide transport system permease protein